MVLPKPSKLEIDHRTLKLLVGLIAFSLGLVTRFFAGESLDSISEAYYYAGWSQNVFVGFLFAVSAFLLAYNGYSTKEMILSKIAAAAAFGVATFPCRCGRAVALLYAPYVHYASAATMFLVLAYLSLLFRKRAKEKGHPEAERRAKIYLGCSIVIATSVVVLGLDALLHGAISGWFKDLTYYGELLALMAFGVSWLVASRIVPGITRRDERLKLLGSGPAET